MSSGWSTSTTAARRDDPQPEGDDQPRPPIGAVLFDFGGVFITSPFAAAAAAAEAIGIPEGELLELVFGPYDVDGDHPWHRLERGEITFDAATAAIADLAEAAGHARFEPMDVFMALATDRGTRAFMVELVQEVRDLGLATGIITNNIAEFGSTWRAMIPVDELFDDVVDSSAVAMRKPDPAIYRLACERLGVAPEAAVFLDDHHGNVVGARAVGMTGICCGLTVETTQAAADELRALLRAVGT